MAEISHPQTGESIDVEVLDEQSHHGDYLQVQALADDVSLSDESGEAPWVNAEEVTGR